VNLDRLTTPWWALRVVLGAAAFLAGYTRLGGYIAAAWLVCIAANLLTTGRYFDVAVRDVAMAVAAFTLARMTEAGVVSADARVRAANRVGNTKTVTA
jgi:hypothetical protein